MVALVPVADRHRARPASAGRPRGFAGSRWVAPFWFHVERIGDRVAVSAPPLPTLSPPRCVSIGSTTPERDPSLLLHAGGMLAPRQRTMPRGALPDRHGRGRFGQSRSRRRRRDDPGEGHHATVPPVSLRGARCSPVSRLRCIRRRACPYALTREVSRAPGPGEAPLRCHVVHRFVRPRTRRAQPSTTRRQGHVARLTDAGAPFSCQCNWMRCSVHSIGACARPQAPASSVDEGRWTMSADRGRGDDHAGAAASEATQDRTDTEPGLAGMQRPRPNEAEGDPRVIAGGAPIVGDIVAR